MQVTAANIRALQTGYSGIFRSGMTTAETKLEQLATPMPSNARTNTYGWMQKLLAMRRWDGPRVIQNLKTFSYMLENIPFELTVGVQRRDIRDDLVGVYNSLFDDMGRQSKLWPDQQLRAALQAGTTGLGFDGVAMFSTAHPLNPAGNQSNNFTTTALTGPNFATVRAAMGAYTGEDGEPLGVQGNVLIVPPQLEDTANSIVTLEYGTGGISNVQKGQAKVIVVPQLANQGTTWYVADNSNAIKGLIWQLREAPEFTSKAEFRDDNVFFEDQLIFGVNAEGVPGYGPWFLLARAIA
jgi:phage major head subunit gpT-like protein